MRRMTEDEKDAFIGGVEMGIDWNLYIPPEDYKTYCELIDERLHRSNGADMAAGGEHGKENSK